MSGDRIDNSKIGQIIVTPSSLHEQFFSDCLAKQADTQTKMGISSQPETAMRTVDQCQYVANLQIYGSLKPFFYKNESSVGTPNQVANPADDAAIQETNKELLKRLEK